MADNVYLRVPKIAYSVSCENSIIIILERKIMMQCLINWCNVMNNCFSQFISIIVAIKFLLSWYK